MAAIEPIHLRVAARPTAPVESQSRGWVCVADGLGLLTQFVPPPEPMLSALDVYWAAFSDAMRPLEPELCPMLPMIREMLTVPPVATDNPVGPVDVGVSSPTALPWRAWSRSCPPSSLVSFRFRRRVSLELEVLARRSVADTVN